MTRPSDDTLMAYADDALPPDERARVEAHLADDPEARQLVELFRSSMSVTQAAFDEINDRPLPAGLVDKILSTPLPETLARQADPGPATASGSGAVLPFQRRKAPPRATTWTDWRIAAALALMIGGGAGFLAGRDTGSPDVDVAVGPLGDGSALAQILETQRSGSSVGQIAVVGTFRDRDARICREFEWLKVNGAKPAPLAAGVACRSAPGRWTVEGAARVAQAAPATKDFTPSGVPERDALEGLLTLLGAKAALTAAEEQALLVNGWK